VNHAVYRKCGTKRPLYDVRRDITVCCVTLDPSIPVIQSDALAEFAAELISFCRKIFGCLLTCCYEVAVNDWYT